MSKRYRVHGDLTAVMHSAFGGGKGVKIYGSTLHGFTELFLELDAASTENNHKVVVRVTTIGEINPFARENPFSAMAPIKLANSLVSDAVFGNEMTHSLNAGNIALNGNVAVPTGKTLMVGNSAVLTEAGLDGALTSTVPPTVTAWTNTFVARGAVANGASLATGLSTASGNYAIANGAAGSNATGAYSYANGSATTASGSHSYANGSGAIASGAYSRASGSGASASGSYSNAFGLNAKASGAYSMANGHHVEVNAFAETALGSANLTDSSGAPGSWQGLDYWFHVGNGTALSSRSDALTILKNGQTTLTNKDWKLNVASDPASVLSDPPSSTDSGGNALVIEGHAVMKGKVILEQPQGDISMGIYD